MPGATGRPAGRLPEARSRHATPLRTTARPTSSGSMPGPTRSVAALETRCSFAPPRSFRNLRLTKTTAQLNAENDRMKPGRSKTAGPTQNLAPKAPNLTDILAGLRVRLRRKELGLSQTALADRLGITFQ